MRPANSLVAAAMRAAGRSLPDMSLAFALMAAINGSTGSRATLSYGLFGTKPRRRQPGGSKILNAQGWRRKPPETLSCKSVATVPSVGKCPQRSHLLSRLTRSRPLRGSANDQGRGRPCPNTILTLHRWPVAGHGTLSHKPLPNLVRQLSSGITLRTALYITPSQWDSDSKSNIFRVDRPTITGTVTSSCLCATASRRSDRRHSQSGIRQPSSRLTI